MFESPAIASTASREIRLGHTIHKAFRSRVNIVDYAYGSLFPKLPPIQTLRELIAALALLSMQGRRLRNNTHLSLSARGLC